METLWHGEEVVTSHDVIGASLANDGITSAVIRSSFKSAPEVWAGRIGDVEAASRRRTHRRARRGARRARSAGRATRIDVQGWLLAPAQIDAGAQVPAHRLDPRRTCLARRSPRWPDNRAALLSRRGYFVFFPNPRGSYGQGEAFTRANVKDFGYGDLRDVMSGIDAAAASNPDRHRRASASGAGATAAT